MFKSKHFPTLIYMGIIITLLVLVFNLIDIMQKANKISGYSISENPTNNFENINIKTILKEKISSPETPYYIYNTLIILLFIIISVILIRFIYKIKI